MSVCVCAPAQEGNSPLDRDHRLPSLFPPWSGCENPESLRKTPHLASADRGSLCHHTLGEQQQMHTLVL